MLLAAAPLQAARCLEHWPLPPPCACPRFRSGDTRSASIHELAHERKIETLPAAECAAQALDTIERELSSAGAERVEQEPPFRAGELAVDHGGDHEQAQDEALVGGREGANLLEKSQRIVHLVAIHGAEPLDEHTQERVMIRVQIARANDGARHGA
jgi:hypothetical protein